MSRAKPAPAAGTVRLIAGHWRGTRVPVPALPGLRPTSDRVRETLFNWLMPALPGARVLDLYAGTGALGLEAASRGASRVWLVEREAAAVAALRQTLARLPGGERVEVVAGDALAWLGASREVFDIAFVDPPFAAGAWNAALAALTPRLAPDARVYVESPAGVVPDVPAGWQLHREGGTRDVRFALYRAPGESA